MEQRTVYIASDGTQFSDPELCSRYETSKVKWESALQSVQSPGAAAGNDDWSDDLDLRAWMPSDYPRDPGGQVSPARVNSDLASTALAATTCRRLADLP